MGWLSWVTDRVDDLFEDVVAPIVEPVMNTVSGVVESALDDPVKAAAQAAAVATGNAWALPIIAGVDTAMEGGDIEDIAKSAAKSYVMQEAGSFLGDSVGSDYSSPEFGAAVDYSVNDPFGGSMPPSSNVMGTVASNAAKSGISAAMSGKDPLQAIVSGGISSLIPVALNELPEFANLPDFLKSTIVSTIRSEMFPPNAVIPDQVLKAFGSTPQQAAQTISQLQNAQANYNNALAQMLASQTDPFYSDVKVADLEEMFSGKTPIYYRSPA